MNAILLLYSIGRKRSGYKPRLIFAVVVIGLFSLATVGSLFSVVLKQFTPALTDEEVVVIGYLAAFECQKQNGRISDAQGRGFFRISCKIMAWMCLCCNVQL